MDEIISLLKQVNHDSPWGLAIKKWQGNPNGDTVVLISQLKSQAEDNPSLMEEILGKRLTQLICTLS